MGEGSTLEHWVSAVFEPLALALEVVAIAIAVFGAAQFVWQCFRVVIFGVEGDGTLHALRKVRAHLGAFIMASLELLIVSDIIQTVLHRTLEELTILALLVIIRTAIGFFLSREINEIEETEKEGADRYHAVGAEQSRSSA